jgi:hypothetical protein
VKDTVTALRTNLEELQAGRDGAVQEAVAAAQDEIRQLRHTVQALRDDLQALQAEKEQVVQAAVAAGHAEARQLHQAIAALRTELETAIAVGSAADIVALDTRGSVFAGRSGDAVLDSWIFGAPTGSVASVWRAGNHVVCDGRHVDRPVLEARYRQALTKVLG